jgi:hypothetical protein
MSLILEIGIAVLSLNRNLPRFPLRRYSDYEEVARFLRDSIGPNREILGRRELVVRGWPERDIRRISKLLVVGLGNIRISIYDVDWGIPLLKTTIEELLDLNNAFCGIQTRTSVHVDGQVFENSNIDMQLNDFV